MHIIIFIIIMHADLYSSVTLHKKLQGHFTRMSQTKIKWQYLDKLIDGISSVDDVNWLDYLAYCDR